MPPSKPSALTALIALAAAPLLGSSLASAQTPPPRAPGSAAPCLSIVRRAAVAGALDGVASLVDDVVLEPGCEVALRQDSPTWTPLAPGARSFLALVAEAQGLSPAAPRSFALVDLPHAVYARRSAAALESGRPAPRPARRGRSAALSGAPGQSFVLLSRCVDSLGQRPSLDARVLPAAHACEGPLEVRAAASASCPARLRVGGVELDGSQPRPLDACAHGVAATYAVDAGSGRDPLRVIVGMVLARDATTPLQQHFRSLNARPTEGDPAVVALFAPRLDAGLWGLYENPLAPSALRAELCAAAAADELVFARGSRALGTVIVTGDREPVARVPDAVFREALRSKFGPAGESLAPTVREARDALAALRVCIPGRYSAHPSTLARVSDRDACAPLARVLADDSDDSIARAMPARRLWAERTLWRVTARGLEPIERSRSSPVPLDADAEASLSWVLSTGDRVGVEGDPRSLYLCSESGCAPLGEAGSSTLDRAGLYELRAAPSPALASTAQSTTLARWVAIDPLRDWLPVGLVTSRDTLPGPLWMQLARDDDETFAWERRAHSLSTRAVFTERAVAVRARARAEASVESVLTSDLPVLSSDTRRAGAPSSSALTVVFSRDERCPDARASDARAMATIEPDALAPASVFYLFLAEDRGPDRPLACIARARFRVRPRRALASAGPVVVGALGDPRVAWFSPWESWGAVGLIAPALYTRASAGPWISTEISLSAVAGFAPGRGAVDVVGPAVVLDVRAAFVTLGAAMFVPRIASDRAPAFSVAPFVALDVGSIYELAGGR